MRLRRGFKVQLIPLSKKPMQRVLHGLFSFYIYQFLKLSKVLTFVICLLLAISACVSNEIGGNLNQGIKRGLTDGILDSFLARKLSQTTGTD